MSNELQRTFGGELIPVGQHPDDMVYREDTRDYGRRGDSWPAADETWFSSQETMEARNEEIEDEITDADNEVFTKYFQGIQDWVCEYSQSDDYAGDYAYLVSEGDHARQALRDFLTDCHSCLTVETESGSWIDYEWKPDGKRTGYNWFPNGRAGAGKRLWRLIGDSLLDSVLSVMEHRISGEYESCNYTDALYLDSFPVGESEEQIELSRIEDDLCDDLQRDTEDALIEYLSTQRDYCIRSGDLGRGRNYPCVYLYVNTDTRIDYIIEHEALLTAIMECTIAHCQRKDYRRKERMV